MVTDLYDSNHRPTVAVASRLPITPSRPLIRPHGDHGGGPRGAHRGVLRRTVIRFIRRKLSNTHISTVTRHVRASGHVVCCCFNDGRRLCIRILRGLCKSVQAARGHLRLTRLTPIRTVQQLIRFAFSRRSRGISFIHVIYVRGVRGTRFIGHSSTVGTVGGAVLSSLNRVLHHNTRRNIFHTNLRPVSIRLLVDSFYFCHISGHRAFDRVFRVSLPSRDVGRHRHRVVYRSILQCLRT